MVGNLGLYTTQFTVKNNSSLISHFGLRGAANTQKLAETFKTPITWGDYCSLVSNCTLGDDVARRKPLTELEKISYFVEDYYTGHFMKNCTVNGTCMGFFANAPCRWTTYAEGQMYWHDIALKSTGPEANGGYGPEHLQQIWLAANATKSNLIMWWWAPSRFKESFAGTESEFQRITFPVPTDECIKYRQTHLVESSRCSGDINLRKGEKIGSCDYQMVTVQKAISKGLAIMVGDDVDNLLRSPALEFLQDVQLPAFSMDTILAEMNGSLPPRDVVCNWVYDNLDYMKSHVPFGFPRKFDSTHSRGGSVQNVARVFSSVALVWVLTTAVLVIKWRATIRVKLAKLDVLIWVLIGATLVVIGALAASLDTTNATCMISKWTTLLGYTIEMVPIIIKIGTINTLVRVARQLQTFDLKKIHLDHYLLGAILFIFIYLMVATLLDPIKVKTVAMGSPYTGDMMNIHVCGICSRNNVSWVLVEFGLQATLLIIAIVLVFQSRDVFSKFNEGQGLTLMVFSHSVFLIMRIIVERLYSTSPDRCTDLSVESILKSLDITLATAFYFGPKFISIWSISDNNVDSRSPKESKDDSSSSSYPPQIMIARQGRIKSNRNFTIIESRRRHVVSKKRALARSLRKKKPERIKSLNLPKNSDGDLAMQIISEMSPCYGLEPFSDSNAESAVCMSTDMVHAEDPQCSVLGLHNSSACELDSIFETEGGSPESITTSDAPLGE